MIVANYALFNASRSTLFISSSVEACPLWKCCLFTVLFLMWLSVFLCAYDIIIIYYCHYYCDNGSQLLSHCTTRYMNYFTCDVKLTWNYRKMYNKCPSGKSLEIAVIVTFLARSLALHQTTEPQEALWQKHHWKKRNLFPSPILIQNSVSQGVSVFNGFERRKDNDASFDD